MINEVYLGDRSILGVEIDGWKCEVRIKISAMSFLFESDYNKKDWDESDNIKNCYIVFSDVLYFESSPPGMLPGDYIVENHLEETDGIVSFTIVSVGRPYSDKVNTLIIKCRKSWIEDEFKQRVTRVR